MARSPFSIWIDAADLIKFVQNTADVPPAIKHAAANALNAVGDKVVNDAAAAISNQTGINEWYIRERIAVTRATPANTVYQINASSALVDAPLTRPISRRLFTQRPSGYFHAEELVRIVSFGDERVCNICLDLEDDTKEFPITIEEARQILPAHPNCRCVVQAHRPRRELPVQFRKNQPAEVGSITMADLAKRIVDEVEIALKVTYGRQ